MKRVSSSINVRTAQAVMDNRMYNAIAAGACGSACGAGDGEIKPTEEKPSACGSACGAGDK